MSALTTIMDALTALIPGFARSDGSIEAKIIDVVATYADSEAIERANTVSTINSALANQRITNRDYYRRKSVAFQIGNELQYDPVSQAPYYAELQPEAQIVKQSYIVGSYPEFTNLVNAIGNDGHLRVLTEEELASFRTYFEAFQPLGLQINVNSLEVAKISDPGITIYVQTGSDAQKIVDELKAAFLTYESVLRRTNTVSLSELEDVMQSVSGVLAIGWGNPVATEQQIDGTYAQTFPQQGLFSLVNGAFTYVTDFTTANVKTLQ